MNRWMLGLVALLAPGCDVGQAQVGAQAWRWELPSHFPEPQVPADNPMTEEKVELGRHLFYDPRLSINQEQSCASCHQQELAFTDGRAHGVGTTGEHHTRGSMSLVNVAYSARLAWSNPLLSRLEDQALLPLFGEAPVEMGMAGQEALLLSRLEADPRYRRMFEAAFPGEVDITLEQVTQALASFERTLISGDSDYDRYLQGEADALSPAARRGMDLFMSERLECLHCHGGFNLSDAVDHTGMVTPEITYHNTGLYNVDGQGAYPASDTGVHEITGDRRDMGRFKAPTLRNIAVTAPYMHDGSIATLSDVLDHYAHGGREISSGADRGDGSLSPLKSEFVVGFVLTPGERQDLLAFLDSLTDVGLLTDPRFSDPFDGAPPLSAE